MAEIVITEFMNDRAVDSLRGDFEVHYDPALHADADGMRAALVDARAVIVRNQTQVTAALLASAPRLVAVGRLGVGLDNIDSAACAAREVAVYPATGANMVAVAEYVIAAMLIGLRGAFGHSTEVAAGAWPRTALVGREVSGSLLGIVGFGAIGRAVAQRAVALGACVQAFDPALPAGEGAFEALRVHRCDTLEALLESSHVVTLHVPLVATTRQLIDAAAIAKMRRDAWLINTARGGIVDEAALASALRAGRVAGAALDVFEAEPLAAGSPFEGLSNVLLTPHIAGLTDQSQARVGEVVAAAVRAQLEVSR